VGKLSGLFSTSFRFQVTTCPSVDLHHTTSDLLDAFGVVDRLLTALKDLNL
jgi:hypothetical protein